MSARAIIIGGSIAGLLAARAVREHFRQVTIVDRDFLPSGVEHRPGVPQSQHVHQLLLRGLQLFEELAPGFTAALESAGAQRVDLAQDIATYTGTGWAPRFTSGLHTFCASRALLETTLRHAVAGGQQIELIEGAEVVELTTEAATARVTGVRARWRARPGDATFAADLVIDASGARSQAPGWLGAHGFEVPVEDTVAPFLGYSSRVYEPPTGRSFDWTALYIPALPPALPRGGLILPIEGSHWLVTLSGASHHYPPTKDAGFTDFARSLAHPCLAQALELARPLSPVVGFRRTENRIRRYDQVGTAPEGFVCLGDAVGTFNPIYGQGMTAAAMGAHALRARLEAEGGMQTPGFALRCQRAIWSNYLTPWLLSTAQDRMFPDTEAVELDPRSRSIVDHVQRAAWSASQNRDLYAQFLRVTHFVEPIDSLFESHTPVVSSVG